MNSEHGTAPIANDVSSSTDTCHLIPSSHIMSADLEHPEDAYMTELDCDETGRIKPATEDGQGFKYSQRAIKAQRAVGIYQL